MPVTAVPRVSVDLIMIVLCGLWQVTFRVVVSEAAWNSNWSQIRLAQSESVIVSISGERSTICLWKRYLESWVSIVEWGMRVSTMVCIAVSWDGWYLIWMAGAAVFLKLSLLYLLAQMQRKVRVSLFWSLLWRCISADWQGCGVGQMLMRTRAFHMILEAFHLMDQLLFGSVNVLMYVVKQGMQNEMLI